MSFFDSNNKSEKAWRKLYMDRKIKITKDGKTFIALIKDTCADSDTKSDDCTRNAKGGFLIDVEYWTAKKYLGSTNNADGVTAWEWA